MKIVQIIFVLGKIRAQYRATMELDKFWKIKNILLPKYFTHPVTTLINYLLPLYTIFSLIFRIFNESAKAYSVNVKKKKTRTRIQLPL